MRLYNALTGQHERVQIHTDRNLDGVIDEKDKEVKYDFNYGVLTTRLSFSCGNLFPIMMQEHGAVLLGEPSGGGSCSVQIAVLSSGAVFMMSSAVWTFRNQDDESVEDGCRTDLLIERIEKETTVNMNPRLSPGDYAPFFDDEMLDKMMNEWFAPAEEAPAA
jgi:C-terminal processing protease CtpA/Prc